MGQKVNPHGLRVGIIKDWDSVWYAEKGSYADFLVEDDALRKYIYKELGVLMKSGVSKINIKRVKGKVNITVNTSKPGVVIGKNGATIQKLSADLQKPVKGNQKVLVNIEEIKKPDLDAQLVAEDIAAQLENRIAFRRAMRQGMTRAMTPR